MAELLLTKMFCSSYYRSIFALSLADYFLIRKFLEFGVAVGMFDGHAQLDKLPFLSIFNLYVPANLFGFDNLIISKFHERSISIGEVFNLHCLLSLYDLSKNALWIVSPSIIIL